MDRRTAVILGGVVVALMGVIGLTVYLLQSQQDVRSRAQTGPTPQASPTQSCPIPAQVQNVLVEFPNCVGDICNFTQASCSWNSVAGATKYQLTITEVDTSTIIKNGEEEAAITRVVFPITQNRTYKCEVSAKNSCGASGQSGSHSLLCEVDAAVVTPTPIPPTQAPVQNDCGFACASNENCKSGLTCAIGASGQGLCSIPSFSQTCQSSPSISSCCSALPTVPATPSAQPTTSAPTTALQNPPPTIPPSGNFTGTILVGTSLMLILIIGTILFII